MTTTSPEVILSLLLNGEDKVQFSQKFGLTTIVEISKIDLLKKPLVDFIAICQQGIDYKLKE